MLKDGHGRTITYLRLSLTDRCNFRCRYCRPQREFRWLPHEAILTMEELARLAGLFVDLGVRKVRLTGGEPLVRRGVVELARTISGLPGLQELCLTTNGLLLREMAGELLKSGVTHLNISLDTLDPRRFQMITGVDGLSRVLEGIDEALALGFDPVKINAVVMRGVNLDEVDRLAALSIQRPLEVRFIEFMPVGHDSSWDKGKLVEVAEIKSIVTSHFGRLIPVASGPLSGPARLFKVPGAQGKVGFISPMSDHFCQQCNRVRITADGRLRLCLFSDDELDLKRVLRDPQVSDEELKRFLAGAVGMKPQGLDGHHGEAAGCQRIMSTIGG